MIPVFGWGNLSNGEAESGEWGGFKEVHLFGDEEDYGGGIQSTQLRSPRGFLDVIFWPAQFAADSFVWCCLLLVLLDVGSGAGGKFAGGSATA
jgi:hypothetical protein